jgi:hypothetical protein
MLTISNSRITSFVHLSYLYCTGGIHCCDSFKLLKSGLPGWKADSAVDKVEVNIHRSCTNQTETSLGSKAPSSNHLRLAGLNPCKRSTLQLCIHLWSSTRTWHSPSTTSQTRRLTPMHVTLTMQTLSITMTRYLRQYSRCQHGYTPVHVNQLRA